MSYFKLIEGIYKLFPYAIEGYKRWRANRRHRQKQQQQKVEKINEQPYDTFRDDMGPAAGRVHLDSEHTKSKRILPTNTDPS